MTYRTAYDRLLLRIALGTRNLGKVKPSARADFERAQTV